MVGREGAAAPAALLIPHQQQQQEQEQPSSTVYLVNQERAGVITGFKHWKEVKLRVEGDRWITLDRLRSAAMSKLPWCRDDTLNLFDLRYRVSLVHLDHSITESFPIM